MGARVGGASRRSTWRVVLAVIVVAAAVVGPAGAAGAQGTERELFVRLFDGGGPNAGNRNTIELVWNGPAADVAGLTVTENDEEVSLDGAPSRLTRDRGVVFVIDSGTGMNEGNVLPGVRDTILRQARQFPNLDYGVVQAGDRADMRADFTRDPTRLENALGSIGPTEGSAVWNGLALAASMLDERTRLQPNIVLISASSDLVNPEAAAVARSAVVANGAMTQVLVYQGEGHRVTNPAPYRALAETYGGELVVHDSRDAFLSRVADAVTVVADRQYSASWISTAEPGAPLQVSASIGEHRDTINVLAGRGVYQGYQQLHPDLGSVPATLPLVDNKVALALALLLAAAAVAGIAFAVTTAMMHEDLSNVLQPYADAYGLIDGDTGEPGGSGLAKTAFVKRAVAITEQMAEKQGLLVRAEAALERGNLPLRAGEALFFYVMVVVVATLIPLLLTQNLLVGLLTGVLGAIIPLMVVSQIARRRRKSFMSQLPDTLSLLSGTLKAGYSLMQGVEAVSQEVAEPMGLELRRVVTESRLGRPLEESLEASADRMDSPDFAWAVMAIRIQREVGGNLAELLLTVADTMVARERLRRDVAVLTAEGRVSAYMLAAMPPILAGVMYVLNQAYVSTLFTEALGIGMVILAVISMVVGFFWMKKIITIEI
jgi:tight adherence protein B